jgi:hypothetical protein
MGKIMYVIYLFVFLISAIPLFLTLKISLKAKDKIFTLFIIVCLMLDLVLVILSHAGIAEYCAVVFV